MERCPLSPPPVSPDGSPHGSGPAQIPPRLESPWYTDVTGGVLAAAGAIAVGVGAAYLVMGDHDIRDANHTATLPGATLSQIEQLASSGSRDRQIGGWSIAGGSALLVGAGVRYALHRRSGGATGSALRVMPAAGGAAVSWGGMF
jgi:hypothetical protein